MKALGDQTKKKIWQLSLTKWGILSLKSMNYHCYIFTDFFIKRRSVKECASKSARSDVLYSQVLFTICSQKKYRSRVHEEKPNPARTTKKQHPNRTQNLESGGKFTLTDRKFYLTLVIPGSSVIRTLSQRSFNQNEQTGTTRYVVSLLKGHCGETIVAILSILQLLRVWAQKTKNFRKKIQWEIAINWYLKFWAWYAAYLVHGMNAAKSGLTAQTST